MKATFNDKQKNNAVNMGGDKEQVGGYKLVAVRNGELVELATLRLYMGRSRTASKVYCSLWITGARGEWRSGHGTAGGWGYHKPSAAAADAFRNAGIELSDCIAGRGDSAIEGALKALGKAYGYRKVYIIEN